MQDLIKFQVKSGYINIAEEIELHVDWELVGLTLLRDSTGKIVSAIKERYVGDATKINVEILSRWVQGHGITDRTWCGLLDVLKEHCSEVADVVEEVLTEEEAMDTEQGKLL